MLRGNWLSALEAVGLLAIVVFCAVTFGRLTAQSERPSGSRNEQQYSYSEQNNGDAKAWSPAFDIAKNPRSYSADCRNPKDREEADLCQQWRSAMAAEKAADLAESQWWWNWVQLMGVGATALAAVAAASAAKAAREAISITVNMERPNVLIVGMSNKFDENNLLATVIFEIENIGRLPAIFLGSSIWISHEEECLHEMFATEYRGNWSSAKVLRDGEIEKTAALPWPLDIAALDPDRTLYMARRYAYQSSIGMTVTHGFFFTGRKSGFFSDFSDKPQIAWLKCGGEAVNFTRERTQHGE
jgi:hypothetical protein